MEKLTRKGKHTVRERNYLHTNISKPATVRRGEHKCRTLEMHLKLKDQQRKTILFLYRLLYQNLMVTANWKSTLDTQKQKRNPNTTLKLVIKSWEQKKKGRKIIYKTKSNIIKNGTRQWEFVIWLGTQTWVELCNNLEGWDWERSRRMV